jgi:hypothetical protein
VIPVYDDPLSAEELRRLSVVATRPEDLEEMLDLIRWFCRRYPTPLARLNYVRARMKAARRANRVART